MRKPLNIIAPKTVVRLIRAPSSARFWRSRMGKRYRIGYYSPQDGLDTVWLVDEFGKYIETADQEWIAKYFWIERRSNEKDYFGRKKRRLGPLPKRKNSN